MENLQTRPYAPADAPAVTALSNLAVRHAGGVPSYTVSYFADYFDEHIADPESDSRLLHDGDALVAVAAVTTPASGECRVSLVGAVHPDWRGRGIGRELLAWQLDRAEQIRAARLDPGAAEPPQWQVGVGVVDADQPTIRLLERVGFAPARYWFEMVAPQPPASTDLPELSPLRIVSYHERYEHDLYAAHQEAFADHWGFRRRELPQWRRRTVGSPEFLPDHSVLALDGDQIAGYLLGYRAADPDRLYIGQVGVRPAWRRRGVAQALLIRVRQLAAETGLTKAALAVDADSPTGAVGVYERAGFVTEARTATYRRPLGG